MTKCLLHSTAIENNIYNEGNKFSIFFYKLQCDSDSFTKWEFVFFLLCKCTILSTRNNKIEVESFFIEQNCTGFVPNGSTPKVSSKFLLSETNNFSQKKNLQPLEKLAKFISVSIFHRESIIYLQNIVTKWIKSCLLQCFGTFKMPILMFISVLVFRPEGQS